MQETEGPGRGTFDGNADLDDTFPYSDGDERKKTNEDTKKQVKQFVDSKKKQNTQMATNRDMKAFQVYDTYTYMIHIVYDQYYYKLFQ